MRSRGRPTASLVATSTNFYLRRFANRSALCAYAGDDAVSINDRERDLADSDARRALILHSSDTASNFSANPQRGRRAARTTGSEVDGQRAAQPAAGAAMQAAYLAVLGTGYDDELG